MSRDEIIWTKYSDMLDRAREIREEERSKVNPTLQFRLQRLVKKFF